MLYRYRGTADISYRKLVKKINNKRLSKAKRRELLSEVDHLVAHLLEDFEYVLHRQYSTYEICGSRFLKTRHWFTRSRDMLMEVALKSLGLVSLEKDRFKKAGHTIRPTGNEHQK